MKLITLNIWGGAVHEPLLKFFAAHQDVDIFCLQEVYSQAEHKISRDERKVYLDILSEIKKVLPNHISYFRPTVNNNYGIAILVNKNLQVVSEGEKQIHCNPDFPGMGPDHSRNLQWLTFINHDQTYTVVNVHCLWNGKGKTDSPARLEQSHLIREFMDSIDAPKILCGDFNLRPDTESLAILAEDMADLIKINQITSTRTSFYPKEERYADYVFVSDDIEVKTFAVLPEDVSDHAALQLDFA